MPRAPSSRAKRAFSVPWATTPEHTSVGIGSSAMILRRKVSPSILGISRSRTTTCGRICFIFCIAIRGSAATATAISGSWERMACMTSRTTAESSTTRTWIGEGLLWFCIIDGIIFSDINRGDDAPQTVAHRVQAFSMPEKEVSIRGKKTGQASHDPLTAALIEIDQNIPAKNHLEFPHQGIRGFIQIHAEKSHDGANFRPRFHLAGLIRKSLKHKGFKIRRRNFICLCKGPDTSLGNLQGPRR